MGRAVDRDGAEDDSATSITTASHAAQRTREGVAARVPGRMVDYSLESARHPVMSSVFKTVDGALAFRGGFDSHALSQSAARAT